MMYRNLVTIRKLSVSPEGSYFPDSDHDYIHYPTYYSGNTKKNLTQCVFLQLICYSS